MTADSEVASEKSSGNVTVDGSGGSNGPSAVVRPLWRSILLVTTCTLAMITNIASSAAVSIFLPVVGEDLSIPEDQLQWLVSAFSVSSGCLLLLLGRLADLFGRKRFFILGTIWLGVLSIGCGFCQSSTAVYILRGFQGLGPAAFIPASRNPGTRVPSLSSSLDSIRHVFGWCADRGALGTQIGALLAQDTRATWRSPFFLFAGLSALCVLGGILAIDPDLLNTETDKRVDWIGAFLVTAGLVLLLFVLGQGQLAPRGWRTNYIIALLLIGVLLIVLFVLWQHRLEKSDGRLRPPLMKLTMFKRARGRFAVMQMIAFFQWSAFLSWYFWAQVYYENYVKLPPVLAALRMLPMTVAGALCNVFVVFVISRIDLALLIVFGTSFTGVGALLFAIIRPSAPYWAYGFPSPIISVFGADFVFAAGTLFVAKVSLPHEQSLAGGLFQTLTQLVTAFGLAISTLVHNTVADGQRGNDAPLEAYQAAQWTAFGMAMLCTILAGVFLRGVGAIGVDERSQRSAQELQEESDSDTVWDRK